ncbi:MAG: hypothetical protein DMG32_03510 [Acidobacteria bacterium]|nr:MAG: hypothetical protein DMG32_03510 [Acidobacteriota bacterium]
MWQKVYVAARTGFAQKESQYISCINCHSEFDGNECTIEPCRGPKVPALFVAADSPIASRAPVEYLGVGTPVR